MEPESYSLKYENLLDAAKYLVYPGGRRSGKTATAAQMLVPPSLAKLAKEMLEEHADEVFGKLKPDFGRETPEEKLIKEMRNDYDLSVAA